MIRNKSVVVENDTGGKIGTFLITQNFTEDYNTASISASFKNESVKKLSFDYEIIGDTSFILFYDYWKYEGHLDLVIDKQNVDIGVIASSTIRVDGQYPTRLNVTLKNVTYSD